MEAGFKEKNIPIPKIHYFPENDFAPIYDSGSSLGRELLDDTVELYLQSDKELNLYVAKGKSEIHWENKKITHFELIRNLLDTPHRENIRIIIDRVIQKYDGSKIEEFLRELDQNIPESHAEYRIPEPRKQLIFKIITLRFETLKAQLDG